MKLEATFQHLENVNPKRTDEICIIGRQADGKSVCARVTNVQPHVCVRNWFDPDGTVDQAEHVLNKQIHLLVCSSKVLRARENVVPNFARLMHFDPKDYVTVEEFKGQDIMDYDESGPVSFFRIKCKSKRYMYDLKKVLENRHMLVVAHQLNKTKKILSNTTFSHYTKSHVTTAKTMRDVGFGLKLTIYNGQTDFMLQYFIDKDISSCAWLKCSGEVVHDKVTTCDIELCVETLEQVESQGMAPWRIFSYDIESLPRPIEGKIGKFAFPEAENDPVVTIGGILQIDKEIQQFVWILRPSGEPSKRLPAFSGEQDCDYRPEITTVYDFDNEAKMIDHFFSWCIKEDVDLIQGHNCNRFDNKYMIGRYLTIFKDAPLWGRIKTEMSTVEEKTFSSNQKGANKQYKLHLPGRIVFDSYDIMKDQHNEASYKLNDLAASYLGTKKVPMDYAEIYPKYHTLEGRIDLAVYCVKDAWLVYKLLSKLCKLTCISQMANVTGIGMKSVLSRGQGIRTMSLMLRYAKKREVPLLMPKKEVKSKTITRRQFVRVGGTLEIQDKEVEVESSFQGAVVVDPDTGFYTEAVPCLDFASLYPSIMVSMNMCYSTLVTTAQIAKLKWVENKDVRTIPDYDLVDGKLSTKITPGNPAFVTKDNRLGLLPEILWDLWQERKRVKRKMKKEVPHSTMYNVLDGTQLALKVCMNSIYGFTAGYMLRCKRIASSVTKYGRGLILKTKSLIENHPEWGRGGHGATCIYGDTDSVFVRLPKTLVGGKTDQEIVEKSHKMGEVMASYVTKFFLDPVLLEYEKTYLPFLLLKKKRYAGMKYEPGLPQKLHIKGLESVRRDYAPLLVETQKKVLDALIRHKNVDMACQIVRETVHSLQMNNVPLEKLIMSKKLSRPVEQYKSKAPHVLLTKRLMKETPDVAPVSGDRVPFVIHAGTGGTSERACMPEEITSGKFIVDRKYYLQNQLMKPLMRIMERVISDPQQLFECRSVFIDGPSKDGVFGSWKRTRNEKKRSSQPSEQTLKKKKKTVSITSFFKNT